MVQARERVDLNSEMKMPRGVHSYKMEYTWSILQEFQINRSHYCFLIIAVNTPLDSELASRRART